MQLSVSSGSGSNLFKIWVSVVTAELVTSDIQSDLFFIQGSVPDFVDPSKSPSHGGKLPALIKVCGQMTAFDRR